MEFQTTSQERALISENLFLCLALSLSASVAFFNCCGVACVCVCRSLLAGRHHTVYFIKGAEESSPYYPSLEAKFLPYVSSFFSVRTLQTQWFFSSEKSKFTQHPFVFIPLAIFLHLYIVRSKQHTPHHHSPKSGSTPPGGNYVDYMIVEPPQSPLRMQTASMDPYTYHQVNTHTHT